jgi:hypothetical protein
MLSAVAMTASRVSTYLEWIAISLPPPALFYAGMIAGMRRPPACSTPRLPREEWRASFTSAPSNFTEPALVAGWRSVKVLWAYANQGHEHEEMPGAPWASCDRNFGGSRHAVGRQRQQRKDHRCYGKNDRCYGKNDRGPCGPLQRQRRIFLSFGCFDLCLSHSSPNLNLWGLAVNGPWVYRCLNRHVV